MVPLPTSTSINSSMPATGTVTLTINLLSIANLSPALQQKFSLVQQYIYHTAIQPNLSPVSNCDNSNGLPQCFNTARLTFTQASANHTYTANAPLYQVAGQHPAAMYQLPAISISVMLLQLQNPQHTLPQQLLAASTLQQTILNSSNKYYQLLFYLRSNYYQLLPFNSNNYYQPLFYLHSNYRMQEIFLGVKYW